MRFARISKKHVFPIIISLLVQFHLPQASLLPASAAGGAGAELMVFEVLFDQGRTIPYRKGMPVAVGAKKARLLGVNKVGGRIAKSGGPRNMKMVITAYSSTPDQTDASPCITANGFNVCTHNRENVIAANFLPFGTRVKIPELFGEKEFIVQDRMNARYSNRIDIWMTSRQKAKQFGVKRATIVVVQPEQKAVPLVGTTQIAGNF